MLVTLRANPYRAEPDTTHYLVATSAGEVGVDLDADHLVCDLSTLDSMIQRLGSRLYPWLKAQFYLERSICQSQVGRLDQARQDLETASAIADSSEYGTLSLRVLGMAVGWQEADFSSPVAIAAAPGDPGDRGRAGLIVNGAT